MQGFTLKAQLDHQPSAFHCNAAVPMPFSAEEAQSLIDAGLARLSERPPFGVVVLLRSLRPCTVKNEPGVRLVARKFPRFKSGEGVLVETDQASLLIERECTPLEWGPLSGHELSQLLNKYVRKPVNSGPTNGQSRRSRKRRKVADNHDTSSTSTQEADAVAQANTATSSATDFSAGVPLPSLAVTAGGAGHSMAAMNASVGLLQQLLITQQQLQQQQQQLLLQQQQLQQQQQQALASGTGAGTGAEGAPPPMLLPSVAPLSLPDLSTAPEPLQQQLAHPGVAALASQALAHPALAAALQSLIVPALALAAQQIVASAAGTVLGAVPAPAPDPVLRRRNNRGSGRGARSSTARGTSAKSTGQRSSRSRRAQPAVTEENAKEAQVVGESLTEELMLSGAHSRGEAGTQGAEEDVGPSGRFAVKAEGLVGAGEAGAAPSGFEAVAGLRGQTHASGAEEEELSGADDPGGGGGSSALTPAAQLLNAAAAMLELASAPALSD